MALELNITGEIAPSSGSFLLDHPAGIAKDILQALQKKSGLPKEKTGSQCGPCLPSTAAQKQFVLRLGQHPGRTDLPIASGCWPQRPLGGTHVGPAPIGAAAGALMTGTAWEQEVFEAVMLSCKMC